MWALRYFFVAVVYITCFITVGIRADVIGLSCQGTTYATAIAGCPDGGSQRASAGGNVTVYLYEATNLPNKDATGTPASVSDPYVKFTAGDISVRSTTRRNTLNPDWGGEAVNIGVLTAATLIKVEIVDADSGLEFVDDLLVSDSMRVPYCSTISAGMDRVSCVDPFDCRADDSRWAMPDRQMCNESGFVFFGEGTVCTDTDICLRVMVEVVPLQIEIEFEYSDALLQTPQISVAGDSTFADITSDFGFPFIGDTSSLDFQFPGFRDYLNGALMIQMSSSEKSFGDPENIKFFASINLPATIYVCRTETDNDAGLPSWIANDYDDANVTVTRLRLQSENNEFACYFLESPGTEKNEWGGVVSDVLTFRTNTIAELGTNNANYLENYIVLATPRTIATSEDTVRITFDNAQFFVFLLQYGIVFSWFLYFTARLLKKIDYRVDRLESFLSSRMLTGEHKTLLATLLVGNKETPCNVHYRAHLFHARNAICCVLLIPFFLLIGWGFAVAGAIQPKALGYGIVFVGSAALLSWYGLKLWEANAWRLSTMSIFSISLAVALFFAFILAAIVVDPAVTEFNRTINFAALSLLFGTMNAVPLIFLVFKKDKSQHMNMRLFLEKLNAASNVIKGDKSGWVSSVAQSTTVAANKLLHMILGSGYTLNPQVPYFKYSTVLQEPYDPKEDEDISDEIHITRADNLYFASLVILFVYLMIAVTSTDYPSVAFLHCMALLLLDAVHASLNYGNLNWSPAYKVTLLVLGRLLIMGTAAREWIVNYSIVYALYSLAFINEVIDTYLPMLSKKQAGKIVFAGVENQAEPLTDIAGSPHFCLGILTFSFVAVVIIAAMDSTGGDLPAVSTEVWLDPWETYTFGVIALAVTAVGGLCIATYRAFYLQKHNLLTGAAKNSYMFQRGLRVPIILAMFSEIGILASGILVYGITQSATVLVLCVFGPPVVAMLGYATFNWIKNDYELVVWPPKDMGHDQNENGPSDLEVAFNMIEKVFGDEVPEDIENIDMPESDGPAERTLQNFKLPSLEVTGNTLDSPIKMPPLPLKSVLRRKRQDLGIKTKDPIVKDLKAKNENENMASNNASEAWDEFEKSIDAGSKAANAKQRRSSVTKPTGKEATVIQVGRERIGWEETETYKFVMEKMYLPVKRFIKGSKSCQIIGRGCYTCYNSCANLCGKYKKVKIDSENEDLIAAEAEGDLENGSVGPSQRVVTDQPIDELVEGSKSSSKKEDVAIDPLEKLMQMPFWTAFASGYLTGHEYGVLFSFYGGLTLIMLMGITLAYVTVPTFAGYVFWFALWTAIGVFIPFVKYFNTYTLDFEMKLCIGTVALMHFIFCVSFFGAELNGDFGLVDSLWILDYFIYFPVFLYIIFQVYRWVDDGCKIVPIDKYGTRDLAIIEYIEYFKEFPIIVTLMAIFVWQMYVWENTVAGNVTLLLLLVCSVGYLFIRDWAVNDYFLTPELSTIGNYMLSTTMFITLAVALLGGDDPITALSVFFIIYMMRKTLKFVVRIASSDVDTTWFLSPYLLPVYTYNSQTHDVVDESHCVMELLYALAAGAVWGTAFAMFYHPVNVGISIACTFLLVFAMIVSAAMSHIPTELGLFAPMISSEEVLGAAKAALKTHQYRRAPLNFEMASWATEESRANEEDEKAKDRPRTAMMMERNAIDLALDLVNETRAASYVRDESGYVQKNSIDLVVEEEAKPWYVRMYRFLMRNLLFGYNLIPSTIPRGWLKHSEGLFSLSDMLAEAIITGRGPFGFLGLGGAWFQLFKLAQKWRWLRCLQQPWLNKFDEWGNNGSVVVLTESIDMPVILGTVKDIDSGMTHAYHEESRCGIHFLMLLMVAADAHLQREQVLFQKFLRENRFRLASNGISPPPEVFSSNSYSSIDICLVAAWLSTLTLEEKERFYVLKAAFSDEQKERDEAIDSDDHQFASDAYKLTQERKIRDNEMIMKLKTEMSRLQRHKIQVFTDSCNAVERKILQERLDKWLADYDIKVDPKDQDLYEKFRENCLGTSGADETTEFARGHLSEIEAAQIDCRVGEYGRSFQFVDSEFFPGEESIGDCEAADLVLGWRCAPGIAENVELFEGGTDPDDIEKGVFKDDWILSALSMLAAAGGVGDGGVDEQIQNFFVPHDSNDGEHSFHTELGAYCVRLFKSGVWYPMVVDDLFPMLKKASWTTENRGMACAHSLECRELWVSIIEKAFAKYYGSYASIQRGYVHHALEDLTGCDAECVTLAGASRGIGKRSLWQRLLQYRKMGYIFGAGTGSAELADKHVQDMGILFESAYTVYDVRVIDGHKLLKLRNPPSDRDDEWKGDWGDKSKLWTKRLKKKLGFVDANDRTFYISFDDFCSIFRYLYVCRWYDPKTWATVQYPGFWQKAKMVDDAESREANRALMMEQGIQVEETRSAKGRKQKQLIDTAGGLPTKHNPECILENNPHYALTVHRTTDVRITVSQSDSRGRPSPNLVPCSIFIIRNEHHRQPMRLTELSKENIVAYSGECKAEVTAHLYATLTPGMYIILIPPYAAGLEGNFTLKVMSNYRAKVAPLWPPRWVLRANKSAEQMLMESAADGVEDGVGRLGKMFEKAANVLFGKEDDDDSLDNSGHEDRDENADGDGDGNNKKGEERETDDDRVTLFTTKEGDARL